MRQLYLTVELLLLFVAVSVVLLGIDPVEPRGIVTPDVTDRLIP